MQILSKTPILWFFQLVEKLLALFLLSFTGILVSKNVKIWKNQTKVEDLARSLSFIVSFTNNKLNIIHGDEGWWRNKFERAKKFLQGNFSEAQDENDVFYLHDLNVFIFLTILLGNDCISVVYSRTSGRENPKGNSVSIRVGGKGYNASRSPVKKLKPSFHERKGEWKSRKLRNNLSEQHKNFFYTRNFLSNWFTLCTWYSSTPLKFSLNPE